MDSFVHLQVRSEYSLLTSTCRINALVERAADIGYDALALTDRNVMYGIHKFFHRCRERGIKPILGLELDLFFSDGVSGTLLLHAMNLVGYQQLMTLSTQAQSRSSSPGVNADFFYRHCSDLIVIIPEKTSQIAQLVQKSDKEAAREATRELQEKIGSDRLYAGSNPPHLPESEDHRSWVEFTEEMKIKRVACGNVAFLEESDEKWRRCLEAIRSDRLIENVSPLEWKDEHPLFSPSYAKTAWEHEKEACGHTVEIRDRCSVNLEYLHTTLPPHEDENETARAKLRRVCFQGASERYAEVDERVVERLEHELAVIERIAFADYFLVVWDFMAYARNAGILTGPGRGSAAGSLVAYCLFITDVDPLAYGLLFERFLNEERVSPPDIDIDFPDHRREEVISYVRKKYGNRHVAQIITFGTFGARAALRDAGKALGTPQSLIEQVIRTLPQSGTLPLGTSRARDEKLAEWLNENDRAKTLFQYAEAIEGLPRHTSLHAAGVVLSAEPLADIVPTVPGELTAVSQFPMEDVGAYGLLKIDFLGLRNLTLLESLRDEIADRYNRTIDPGSIPQDDKQTLAMLAAGDTTGIFQFESAGMQQVLKKLKPTTFEDLVAVNALYRPGPMEQIDTYIAGKHGRQTIAYVHQDLQPILSSTYGVMVYQEQIMQVAVQIADYSLAQADLLRRAVSKKNREELQNERAAFIAGARANGYDEATAEKVYSWILRFADYGFNRSHAVAYSFIAYQLAYYKTHFPHVFFSAYMTMIENDKSRLGRAIREMKNHGLHIYPPSINKSTERFAIENEGVRFPLQTIAQVGRQFSRKLLLELNSGGPFQSFIHFCERTTRLPINRRMLANLIKAGAFDELHRDRATLLASIDRALEFVDFQQDLGSLFERGSGNFRYAEATSFSLEECYRLEKEVTGFYMSGHPLDQYADILAIRPPLLIAELEQAPVKKELWMMGAIEQVKHIRTKNGQTMAFLQLSDESQTCETVIFPAIYRKVNHALQEESYVFIRGKRTVDQYGHKVIAEDVIPIEQTRAEAGDVLYIKLLADKDINAQSRRLKRILQKDPGFSQVRVYNEKTQQLYALADHYRVRINDELRMNLISLVGEKNIVERKKSAHGG